MILSLKKGGVTKIIPMILVSSIILLSLLTIVSSQTSFWESIKAGITGRATSGTFNLNISVGNSPPNITYVSTISAQDITEAGQTRVTFYFTANDSDGYQNIDTTSAKANFTFINATGLIATGKNDSCVSLGNIDSKTINFTCTISLWYFNPSGTNAWNITAYVQDSSSASGQNTTTKFTLNPTPAFVIYPAAFTFGSLSGGSTNTTSNNDPLTMNNTGNYAFGQLTQNISVNATNLVGETNSAYALYGGNFTVGVSTGGSPPVECGDSSASGFLVTQRFVNQTLASLPYGNLSIGSGTAQEQLYVCLARAGNEISSQAYSTNGPNSNGAWQIKTQ
ncbi:MAG: hypothetical protein AABW73_04450 [Nanoarchaeota archaeon]